MLKNFERPAVWSNAFYGIPLVAAGSRGLWLTALAILVLLFFSLAFHYTRERRFIRSDIAAAGIVATFCAALLLSGGLTTGYGLIAGLLVFAGLYIRYSLEKGRRGGAVHGLWHIVAAIVILACILS